APTIGQRRGVEDPVAIRLAELTADLIVAATLVHALLDEGTHLARRVGGRVLYRETLADRASELRREAHDPLRLRLRPRCRRARESDRHRADPEDEQQPRH